MTTHYIDITLLPDPEFSQAHLLGALVSKLHRALVRHGAGDIGVSFPKHVDAPPSRRTLGTVLRLHGTPAALDQLMTQAWLKGMHDHVQIADTRLVPADAQHRIVRRRQFKTSAERLRRRRMRRKGETAEQASAIIPDSVQREPSLPYAQLRSISTSQPFCLFVEHGALQPTIVGGRFNTYGLSLGATIPWF
ncbi:type I-F CRISPR-associated endoribonuclease Cas6/Csy4 [Alicycliphilus denitrificans]|uniref:type I-F CRISPR-associated endoribonuclease Cas6/Csy4 n=1 Tax=Alicycliphilus denitrificans TaxID=179636 RepID=UPI00095AA8CF|nr:type I-F CRISPR-associated endoribonuclease Cas6/Csy4 [Alicycliphilus denitrificans]MBN9572717.1 type I-F CRISPR-associated endoribonuclease Cas6/Csy4 [Alicycliphilus denitrificans]OJW92581.1 MAG: type I-F CRISPR-associated endoribonuclease Cas6/Csy4 [Alicycliphilus sp. 69-12]BCN37304.1 type I-F CRISPR-associated endoribonuclease Cas6/Csy4 [Alicycliphilus denitrificans]